MDVGLSDRLTCPRCGPTYGLVLLPYEVEDRRVRSGVLGCANCRERYAIEEGVGDLRVEAGDGPGPGAAGGPGKAGPAAPGGVGSATASVEASGGTLLEADDAPVRLAGLMGLAEAQGVALVAGPAAVHAVALSALVEGVEVVVVGAKARAGVGVSELRLTTVLPFRSGSVRGVALTGRWTSLLEEGARVLDRAGRLVLDPAPAGLRERLEAAGLRVLVEEDGVAVAGQSI